MGSQKFSKICERCARFCFAISGGIFFGSLMRWGWSMEDGIGLILSLAGLFFVPVILKKARNRHHA